MLLSGAVAGTGAGSKLDRLHNTDRSGSVFFRIGSGFFADPDPDSEKRLIRIREKKPGSETLDFLIIILRLAYFLVTLPLELRVCMFSSAVLSPRLMYYDSAEFSAVQRLMLRNGPS